MNLTTNHYSHHSVLLTHFVKLSLELYVSISSHKQIFSFQSQIFLHTCNIDIHKLNFIHVLMVGITRHQAFIMPSYIAGAYKDDATIYQRTIIININLCFPFFTQFVPTTFRLCRLILAAAVFISKRAMSPRRLFVTSFSYSRMADKSSLIPIFGAEHAFFLSNIQVTICFFLTRPLQTYLFYIWFWKKIETQIVTQRQLVPYLG